MVGIEADIQGSGQQHTTDGTILGIGFSETDRITYFGTIRGRLGLALNRWMPYVTGGWGYGGVSRPTSRLPASKRSAPPARTARGSSAVASKQP